MTDTPQLLLAHHLKALKLPTFLRKYDKVARLCAAEGVDHPRYLMRLAEMEMIDRERCMVERRIKDRDTLGKLFTKIGPRFAARPGGYTRILKLGHRPGDGADVARIELLAE